MRGLRLSLVTFWGSSAKLRMYLDRDLDREGTESGIHNGILWMRVSCVWLTAAMWKYERIDCWEIYHGLVMEGTHAGVITTCAEFKQWDWMLESRRYSRHAEMKSLLLLHCINKIRKGQFSHRFCPRDKTTLNYLVFKSLTLQVCVCGCKIVIQSGFNERPFLVKISQVFFPNFTSFLP